MMGKITPKMILSFCAGFFLPLSDGGGDGVGNGEELVGTGEVVRVEVTPNLISFNSVSVGQEAD